MKTLYAGPWIGEFGWELCFWNPVVRHYASKYDHIIIASHRHSEYLYEFANEFIPIDAKGWSGWKGYEVMTELPKIKADRILSPKSLQYTPHCEGSQRKWRNLSPKDNTKKIADVLCAFRPPKSIMSNNKKHLVKNKDYPMDECRKIIEGLLQLNLSVACYGGKDNYWFENTIDIRAQSLENQCGALSQAKCALGPSSGPIHLASLCECPHITWYNKIDVWANQAKKKYQQTWNPFKTSVNFLGNISPSPSMVLNAVKDIIKED